MPSMAGLDVLVRDEGWREEVVISRSVTDDCKETNKNNFTNVNEVGK